MNHDDEKFLSRWSQKKAEARKDRGETDEADAGEAPENKAPETGMMAESDFDDVDFDALDKTSDYTRFLSASVPDAIQKLALRKLWSSDPVFEVMDGMNDYDEDFSGSGLAGKAMKSAYKIGKGYLLEEEEEKEKDRAEKPAKSKDSPPRAAPADGNENNEPARPREIPDGK